jgi:regulator of sigma E protease
MSTNIISLIVVLGVLIFVHEFGHFLLAKIMGVGVEKFSLGFGPRILGKKIGMTDYRISAIPLGGYVKMVGEAPDAEIDDAMRPLSFSHKSVSKRIAIVLAGPMFNLLLAVVIFFGFFQISGKPVTLSEVGGVQEGMPAEAAGIQEGDEVIAVNGHPVSDWEEMARWISAAEGERLTLKIRRDDETISKAVTPKLIESQNIFGETVEKYVIGISASGAFEMEHLNPVEAIAEGFTQTWRIIELTVVSVGKIISGTLSAKTLGGPIMIAQLAGEHAKAGITELIFFIALLSINLGILNLLPIPVLDGGHLVFFFIEAITRKPVNLRMREIAQQVGILVLIMLMIFVFYNDITRILFN